MHSHGCKHCLWVDDAQIYIHLQPDLSSDLQTSFVPLPPRHLLLMPPRYPHPSLSKASSWFSSLWASSPAQVLPTLLKVITTGMLEPAPGDHPGHPPFTQAFIQSITEPRLLYFLNLLGVCLLFPAPLLLLLSWAPAHSPW